MRKLWHEHQLLIMLTVVAVFLTALATWSSWHEFDTNEGLGMEGKAEFWSSEFLAYCVMQLDWNFLAEIYGFIVIVVFAAKFHEKFNTEK